MSIWSCWFGAKAKASAGARLLERDNLGTRYETHDRVHAFWTPYILSRPSFPFLFYNMPSREAAMAALLELEPFGVAADSGKPISTEVLSFGVYPRDDGGAAPWGLMLAGERVTAALYDAAVASCTAHGGSDPRLSERPPETTATAARAAPSQEAVTFEREEQVDMLAQMEAMGIRVVADEALSQSVATKRHYRGPDQASAIAFLQTHPVNEPFFYLMVHTPEGVFGRDKDGIFDQPS
ncbi:hypothetical protein [Thiocapsa marina]|uniref:Uncharacterized protein n=1 Tax=Thiocapsa marina 5811 TaxID=768671 RepID=F9UIY0_9GAMM|nr:hypothetical protein [Thiocapsa marina]EGV15836.1 hypothetical protein ThimaDRAFT_4883 [Thiocapsa marina 5811]